MKTDFGPIYNAAGSRGYFGEGYLHHKLLGPLGPRFGGCTFAAKTTTLEKNAGNMLMKEDGITPKEFLPKCILPNFRPGTMALSAKMFWQGIMLNAVSLSGPGAEFLFETGKWQEMAGPFWISFMPIGSTPEARESETKKFTQMFAKYLPDFKAKVGLQINYSCPNVDLDPDCLIDEVRTGLTVASVLDVALMPKFNVLASVHAVREISRSLNCDAICISNTIPWGKLPDEIDWQKLFGSKDSPLAEFGGGGFSRWPLLASVIKWIRRARYAGIRKPINACGGILSPYDLDPLSHAGATSVSIGSVSTLRSWRCKDIIQRAHVLFGQGG